MRLAARSLERLGRTAGRLFSVSTAGSIVGTFVDGLLARAGARHRPGARGRRRHAARRRDGLCARRAPARRGALVLVVAAVAAGGVAGDDPRAAESGRLERLGGAELVAALPRARAAQPRGARARRGRGEESGYNVREARDTRYHRMYVLDGDDTRYLRFDSTLPERDAARRPVRHRLRLHRLPPARPRVRADDAPRAVHRARRRVGREAHVARLPVARSCTPSSSIPRSSASRERWFGLPRGSRV